jgi:hypothetical protein
MSSKSDIGDDRPLFESVTHFAAAVQIMLSGQWARLSLLSARCLRLLACSQPDGQSQGSTATSSGSIAGTLTSGDLDSLRQDRAQWTMAAGD